MQHSKRLYRRVLCVLLILILSFGALALPAGAVGEARTLRIAIGEVGPLDPLAPDTEAARLVRDLVFTNLVTLDRGGRPIARGIEGETRSFNGTEYTYRAPVDYDVTVNEDGSADYTFTVGQDVRFADGVPMTADDVIFTLYVMADPAWDQDSYWFEQIDGFSDYKASLMLRSKAILSGMNAGYTQAERDEFMEAYLAAGVEMCRQIIDWLDQAEYCSPEDSVAEHAEMWGYSLEEDATLEDFFAAIRENNEDDISSIDRNVPVYDSLSALLWQQLGDRYDYYMVDMVRMSDTDSIEGIQRLDDYRVQIHTTSYDVEQIISFQMPILPLHYYGDPDLYNYEAHQFGFPMGDLGIYYARGDEPMGAGPYQFGSRERTLLLSRNPCYYLGAPKIESLELVKDKNTVSDMTGNLVDINPGVMQDYRVLNELQKINSNAEVSGDRILSIQTGTHNLGYIGINADRVKLGEDGGSQASKYFRRGIVTILALYRYKTTANTFGPWAKTAEYPNPDQTWPNPQPKDSDYETAFTRDVNGNPIYTPDMDPEQQEAAALAAAKGFFQAAGLTLNPTTGRFEGAPVIYATIPGEETWDHPSKELLQRTSRALAGLGITMQLDFVEPTDFMMDMFDGKLSVWGAAIGAGRVSGTMLEAFDSNEAGLKHGLRDSEIDQWLNEMRFAPGFEEATQYARKIMNRVLDWACFVPYYQRQNLTLVNCETVQTETLTPEITANWPWYREIEKLELKDLELNPFVDVAANKFYYDPILWAYHQNPQITAGASPDTFGPTKTCTRAQVVTFLWRAAGCPEPSGDVIPFDDVKPGKSYTKAVLWAVENGVTNGVTPTSFGTNKSCTRAQVVTFLWRAAGCPEPENDYNPFVDVPEGKSYTQAVLWAVENGITSGTSWDKFSPNNTCNRGTVVTFLYRAREILG